MNKPEVLVPGASSQIGVFALPLLISQGFEVVALSRHGKPSWYADINGVTWESVETSSASSLKSARFILSCGPLALAGELVSRCAELERVVAFSTTSTQSKRESADTAERVMAESIAGDETNLMERCAAVNAGLTLLRPTLVYGCGMDMNISWLARWIGRFGFVPLAGEARGLRQPVHAQDIARTAVTALTYPGTGMLESPLCGGSTLSYQDMVRAVFRALGRKPRLIHLPPELLATMTVVARLVPGMRSINAEMVRRQASDLVYDDFKARSELGHAPRPFEPRIADFKPPPREYLLELAAGDAKN